METDFVCWLRERIPDHPLLLLGLGDDAAILQWRSRSDCVVTTDLLTDQVHFDVDTTPLAKIGHKSLAVNLSDLAAMASQPVGAVISLALPRQRGLQIAQQLYEGILPLAQRWSVALAGGDTNCWSGPLAISVTAIGHVTEHGALRRCGVEIGDEIIVTGELGGSILGKHLDFTPRIDEALRLNELFDLHAAMDISDGLTLDLSRMLAESGCGAELDLDAIPISAAAHKLAGTTNIRQTPLQHALSDGEDFELILTMSSGEAKRLLAQPPVDTRLTRIGRCIEQPGLFAVDATGRHTSLQPRGFTHGGNDEIPNDQ